jgi:glycosyltransferase involved in cell wall biosynthesis
MKKISIIGTVGIPAKYGGFETLTEYLTKNIHDRYELTVFCSGKSYSDKLESYNGAKLEYINLNANGVQSIPYDIISILKSLKFADTLLILGVSGCIVLPFVRLFSKKRIVVNIDGLEWKRDKFSKNAKLFLKFSEKLAVKYSDVVVSDNKAIQDYVRSEYGVQSVLIAYGADHVTKEILSDELKLKYPFLGSRYAFKVCRIEPENNIHLILEAFSEYKLLNIVMIGNWENSQYGRELKEKYSRFENIFLLDPIYEQNSLNQIRSNCYVYMHGHSAGGTNPSLVEAMYLGLPIIAYGVQYNRETTEGKALYFDDKDGLARLLENINDEELRLVARDMLEVAKENYIWEKISEKYSKCF